MFLDEVTLRTTGSVEYRCHPLDSHGQAVWRSKFSAENDAEAITKARAFFRVRADSTCAFELWQAGRYLYCENDSLILDLGVADTRYRSRMKRVVAQAFQVIAHG